MATSVKPIYHLPSLSLDYMSPTEYCKSLTFLPDETPLDLDAQKEWRGTPWGLKRTPIRSAVARALHYDSTPDFDINFTDTKDPCQPKAKCAVIGSERRISEKKFASEKITSIKPANAKLTRSKVSRSTKMRFERRILDEAFNSNKVISIKLESARLNWSKVSKFAKWFEQNEAHGETATADLVHESNHTVTATVTDTPNPYQIRSLRDFMRPKIEHCGDMSNLRPDDRGMNAATCAKFHRISMLDPSNSLIADHSDDRDVSTVLESLKRLTITESDDSDVPTSRKVTFDLGAQFATRSTDEQKARVRARGRRILNKEAAAFKEKKEDEEDEEDIPILYDYDWLVLCRCPNGAGSMAELIAPAEASSQIEEEE